MPANNLGVLLGGRLRAECPACRLDDIQRGQLLAALDARINMRSAVAVAARDRALGRRLGELRGALQVREEPGGDLGGDRSGRETCAVVVEELEALGVNVDAAADVHRERGAAGLRPGVERVESAGELLLGGVVHGMFSGSWVEPFVRRLVRPERGTRRSSTMRAPHCLEGSPAGETGKARGRTRQGRCAVSRRVESVFPAGDAPDGHRAVRDLGERGLPTMMLAKA
jgi:hypothetical protein